MKKRFFLFFLLLFISVTSCTDAARSKIKRYDNEFKIETINCDGTVARTWISNGRVRNKETSDAYYFNDKETGKLIAVNGRLIITKQ